MPALTGKPSVWRLACHFHLSSFALCPLGNLEFDLCFPSTFRDLLPCRNGALGTDETAGDDGLSLPCRRAQASLLNGTQTGGLPARVRGAKETLTTATQLGHARARKDLNLSLLVQVLCVLLGKPRHGGGMMEFSASGHPTGQAVSWR